MGMIYRSPINTAGGPGQKPSAAVRVAGAVGALAIAFGAAALVMAAEGDVRGPVAPQAKETAAPAPQAFR